MKRKGEKKEKKEKQLNPGPAPGPASKKLKPAPLRCKCSDNILHVGSKLLMYTARKVGVSPFKSGYLGGTELMAAAVIKGPRPSRLLSSGDGRLVDMQQSDRACSPLDVYVLTGAQVHLLNIYEGQPDNLSHK